MIDNFISLDEKLFLAINAEYYHPALDRFFTIVSDADIFIVPSAILAAVMFCLGKGWLRYHLVLVLLAVAMADLLGNGLKHSVERLRPYWVLEGVRFPNQESSSRSPSFPSNHAANCFAVATVLGWYFRRTIWVPAVAFLSAITVGYSRVYLGDHFPSDVIGGALLGMGVGAVLLALTKACPPIEFGEGKPFRIHPDHVAVFLGLLLFTYRYAVVMRKDFDLVPEEAQYWDWSRNLAWSYYSKPPLIAWLIRLSTEIFGSTPFGVRFVSVTCTLAMSVAGYFFAREVTKSSWIALAAVVLLSTVPLYAVGALVLTTDTPMMLFWVLATYALYRALFRDQKAMWYVAAVCLGMGLLAKYAMIYIVPCLAIFLALSPRHRHWYRRPEPYLFVLIGLLFFVPVVYWNYQHDWVSFLHVAGQAKVDEGFRIRIDEFGEFLGSQVAVITPFLFLSMAWVTWRFWKKNGLKEEPKGTFLLALGMPVFLGLLLKSLQGNTLANWAAPAYFTWTIFAVWQFPNLVQDFPSPKAKRWLYVLAAGCLLLPMAAFLVIHEKSMYRSIWKAFHAMGITLRPELDPENQFYGWEILGEEITEARDGMPNPDKTFIFAKRYQEAAELAFYVEGQPRTYNPIFGDKRVNQYTIWPGIDSRLEGWDAIYVTIGDGDRLKSIIADHFDMVSEPQYIKAKKHGIEYRRFTYWRLYGFHGEFPDAVTNPTEF